MKVKWNNFFFGEQVTGYLYLFAFKSILIFLLVITAYFIVSPHYNCVRINMEAMQQNREGWDARNEFGVIRECGMLPF